MKIAQKMAKVDNVHIESRWNEVNWIGSLKRVLVIIASKDSHNLLNNSNNDYFTAFHIIRCTYSFSMCVCVVQMPNSKIQKPRETNEQKLAQVIFPAQS